MKEQNIQSDTPEDLFDGPGKRLGGVLGLSSSQANKFRSTKGEGSGDEHGAKALEAIAESTRVIPSARTPVLTVLTARRTTAADEDQSNDHEDDNGTELQARGPEFFFRIAERPKDIDDDDSNHENGNPHGDTDINLPVVNCETGDRQFQWHDNSPLKNVVPTHGEAPGGVNEAGRVGVKTTRDRVHDSEFTESVD